MPVPNAGVSVSTESIMNQLHERYGRQISRLTHECAELYAALEQVSTERDEYKNRVLMSARGVAVPPAQELADTLLPRNVPDNPEDRDPLG